MKERPEGLKKGPGREAVLLPVGLKTVLVTVWLTMAAGGVMVGDCPD